MSAMTMRDRKVDKGWAKYVEFINTPPKRWKGTPIGAYEGKRSGLVSQPRTGVRGVHR